MANRDLDRDDAALANKRISLTGEAVRPFDFELRLVSHLRQTI